MTRFTATVTGDEQVARAFKRAPRIMRDYGDRYTSRAALELARAARGHAPKATSNLVNSIYPDKLAAMDYLIGPHVIHGYYVEVGTRGGGKMPPVQSILDWLKVKGVRALDGGEPVDAAWAMARRIQERGTPAQPFMEPARIEYEARAVQLITQGLTLGMRAAGIA